MLRTNYFELAWDVFRGSRILRVRFASSESRRGISTAGASLKIFLNRYRQGQESDSHDYLQ